jgi:hypothetical protein
MITVIGLVWFNRSVDRIVQCLTKAGITKQNIAVVTDDRLALKILDGDLYRTIGKDALIGALFGIAIFSPYGVMAAWSGVHFFGYSPTYVAVTTIAYFLIGGLFGAFMAHLIGVDIVESNTQLYIKGIALGGALLIVQANDKRAAQVKTILEQENVLGAKFLPEAITERQLPSMHIPWASRHV